MLLYTMFTAPTYFDIGFYMVKSKLVIYTMAWHLGAASSGLTHWQATCFVHFYALILLPEFILALCSISNICNTLLKCPVYGFTSLSKVTGMAQNVLLGV